MLLKVDTKTFEAEKVRGVRLKQFGLDERKLQGVLFRSLERLFPDDELLLLMESQRWREEPDLMALDRDGNLFIFELKAWESSAENLLQVLRYGQIFGQYQYPALDGLYRERRNDHPSLLAAHRAKFEVNLPEDAFNRKQVFVVMTNGLDHATREAVRYWRSANLDVRPWVYRIYGGESDHDMLLEIAAFRVEDNPYEDLAEGYYILNTNIQGDEEDHLDMLTNRKAAAYFEPWKFKIERLTKGDVVFLYQSGRGIVAMGEADGQLVRAPYHGDQDHADQEYYRKLNQFQIVEKPVTAAEIKRVTGVAYCFMSTMFGLDSENGKKLRHHILEGLDRNVAP